MASSLRLITSNLLVVTRSIVPFRCSSVVVSASRFLSIDNSHIARTYTTITPTTDDTKDQQGLAIPCPKLSSLSFYMINQGGYMSKKRENGVRRLELNIPDEGMSIKLELPQIKVDGIDPVFIHGKTHSDRFLTGIKLPADKDDHSVTKFIADDIFTSFRDITQEERSWAYYDMFYDRSFLGKGLCPIIATSPSINSFSIYKKETNPYLSIRMDMPGKEKMKLTSQGLRVSLYMYGLHRDDVKVFYDYDTLFIEGKTEKQHYITGIRLPKGVYKKHNMIKRKMKDEVFYANLPYYVEKEELPRIKDQLKLDSVSKSKNGTFRC